MEGGIGGAKILQKIMVPPPPLSLRLLIILASGRGGGISLKSYKNNGAHLSVIKIVKYCGVGEGRHWVWGGGVAKILQKIMAPPLCFVRIIKYCGQKYNTYEKYNCILSVTN